MSAGTDRIDLKEFVELEAERIRGEAEMKHLHFRYLLEHVSAERVVSHASHLMQLVHDLLLSAVAHTPDGGDVLLSVRELIRFGDLTTLEFYVEDNGRGLSPAESRALLTELPLSGDDPLCAQLLAVKKEAAYLGGHISAETKPGLGTVVRVLMTLPAEGIREEAEQDVKGDINIFAGKTILLVEDHLLNLEIARDFLLRVGIGVETALNGEEALALFHERGGDFDLILMDIRMPVMDGIEATRAIRALEEGRDIPIIALTASAYEGDITRSRAAGMDASILKPINPKKLYGTLREYLFRPRQ